MNVEYLRTAQNSYMIIKETDFCFEPYELQMVLHNRLKCLLPLQIIVADGKVEYWYDVTGMKSLEQKLLVGTADGIMIRQILEGICAVKTELENYLLDDRDIIYQSAMIFWNRTGTEIQFCYIPGYRMANGNSVRSLFEEILQHLNHSDTEAVRMAYGIYECCGSNEPVMEDYRECLYGKKNEQIWKEEFSFTENKEKMLSEEIKPERKVVEEFQPNTEKRLFFRRGKKKKNSRQEKDTFWIPEEEHAVSMVAETNVAQQWGETMYFPGMEMQKIWELVYLGDGLEQNLKLEYFPYLIGKKRDEVDGSLTAQTVSRIHARISEKDEELFVEDFNSTNGTYLNGHLLPMNTPVRLQEGDRLIFATEIFELRKDLSK